MILPGKDANVSGQGAIVTLSLTLPPEVENKLRERAAQSGQAVDEYALRMLADAITATTIDELLAPVRKQVAESGACEDEVMEFGRELLRKVRAERGAAGQ